MTSIGHERQPRTSSVGISPRVASIFKCNTVVRKFMSILTSSLSPARFWTVALKVEATRGDIPTDDVLGCLSCPIDVILKGPNEVPATESGIDAVPTTEGSAVDAWLELWAEWPFCGSEI